MTTTIVQAALATMLVLALIMPVGCADEDGTTIPAGSPTETGSQLIGFMGSRQEDSDYSIFVMNADGTNHVGLAPASTMPSADVWSYDRETLSYVDRDSEPPPFSLWLVDVNDSDRRKVTDLSRYVPMSWSWSVDGKKLFMLCATGGQAEPKPGGGTDERHYFEVFSMDLAGGEIRQLTDEKNIVKYSPLVSPDGKKIAFSATEHDPQTWKVVSNGLYLVGVDGANQVKLIDSSVGIRSFAWSSDSSKIVYCAADDIFVVEIPTGTVHTLTTGLEVSERDPAWSPDGSRIAFTSTTQRGGSQICIMDEDGTNVTILFQLSDYARSVPCWSQDGNSMLFGDRQTVYSVGANGEDLKVVYDGQGVYRDIMFPVWLAGTVGARHGGCLIFHSEGAKRLKNLREGWTTKATAFLP